MEKNTKEKKKNTGKSFNTQLHRWLLTVDIKNNKKNRVCQLLLERYDDVREFLCAQHIQIVVQGADLKIISNCRNKLSIVLLVLRRNFVTLSDTNWVIKCENLREESEVNCAKFSTSKYSSGIWMWRQCVCVSARSYERKKHKKNLHAELTSSKKSRELSCLVIKSQILEKL